MLVLCCTSGYILELAPLLLFMYPLSFDINYYIQKKKKKKEQGGTTHHYCYNPAGSRNLVATAASHHLHQSISLTH